MKAARIIEPEKPLVISDVDTPKPKDSEVLVKVKAVGVCHSDLHLWEGGYDTGDGFMKVTDRGVKFPVIPGHEIVGTITEVGGSVQGFSVGDNVLVYPWIGCGNCPACRVGNDNLCDAPRSLGVFQNGGYAEYVLVPHFKFLAKVSGIDLDAAASLACSGLTAYTAIKKANANSQHSIVIFGAGGLGLMGVQIARAITSANIICVDIDDAKLQTAKELGADSVVNSKDADATQKIISLCGGKGADSVIDFVNAPPTVKMGLAVLRKRGNLILVGLFGGSIDLSLVTVPLKAITIQGAYTGSYNDMLELLGLAKRGVINPIISKRYSLSEANAALEDLKARKILGRAVINP
ncbi:MAG: alcohol dehydrogenase [Candidatus Nitrosotenuis sp.]|uniref:NAD-dependent alcohol dehydrogenase n=1 Tax=Candidatus Nitrosotenuis uzonensis TaxID=1407055 RepID=A0A812EZM3_9ARCH|nr:alcohol dehydrogenase [Candidatus Nitrosotenuis uzonensis]MCA2003672.1 alcohol dehydrogenase [Candidatus Nitrosotenuis sp.]CAE6504751.1 NAD-dependent alcohol dehydrogenase [Candidatus Nitrosotenuis uzonensis]